MRKQTLAVLTILVILASFAAPFSGLIHVGEVKGVGESWLSDYAVRKQIDIAQLPGAGADYPVPLILDNGAGTDSGNRIYFDGAILQVDMEDVAFTEDDGETLLSCWLDPFFTTEAVNATYYVKVSADLSAAGQTIFVYAGNLTCDGLSDPDATFPIFYEDFNDLTNGALNSQNGWSGSTNWAVQDTVYVEGGKAIKQQGGTPGVSINHTLTTGDLVFIQAYLRTTGGSTLYKQTDFYLIQGGSQISGFMFGNTSDIAHLISGAWEPMEVLVPNTWYCLKLVIKTNSTHEAWINGDNYTLTSSANNAAVTTSINKVMIDHYDNTYTNYYDTFVVGKYVDPGPSVTTGALEGNPFVFEPLTVATSTTTAGASCVFSCAWNTSNGLASAVLQSNNTGHWENTTASISGNTSQVLLTLNSTVGTVISYSWFGVDAGGASYPISYFYGLPESWIISDSYNLAAAGSGWEVMNPQDPFIVDMGEGVYRMYYAAWNGTAQNIGYATSTNGGVNWTKQGLVFASTGTGIESDGISAPQILILPNGTWLMYYHTIDSGVSRACLATSSDGLGWTRYAGNPIIDVAPGSFYSTRIDPETIVYDPYAPYPFTMLFGAYDGVTYQGGYAYSYDAFNWNVAADPVLEPGDPGDWDETAVYPVAMYKTGSLYNLIYQGLSANWQLGYAASTDGQNWTKFFGNPTIGLSSWAPVSTENPCNPINYGNGTLFIEFCGAAGGSGAIPAGPYYLGFATAPDPLYGLNGTVFYLTTTAPGAPTPSPPDEPPPAPVGGDEALLTFYFHADPQTINDVAGYSALTTVPDEDFYLQASTTGSANVSWGWRVYLQFESSAQELTGGTPTALITQTAPDGDQEELATATYTFSDARMSFGLTAVRFVLYSSWDGGAWTSRAVYITENLFYSRLLDCTSTFSLYAVRNESGGSTYATVYWGTTEHLSGVANMTFREGTTVDWQSYYLNQGNFLSFLSVPYTVMIGNTFYALILFGFGMSLYLRYRKAAILVVFIICICGSGAGAAINLLVGELFTGILWIVAAFGLAAIYWGLFS